jgi:hypothetical protein
MPPPHGRHDLHGSEYGKARRTVGIIDFERILRGDKRHGMLSMDVVARCRSRVPWVRDSDLPVKPSANDGADLYLGLSTRIPRECACSLCLKIAGFGPLIIIRGPMRLPVQCAPSPHRTGSLAAEVILPTSVCSRGHVWWRRRGDVMMILMSVLKGFLIGQGIFLRYRMSATGPPQQNDQRILLQLLPGCDERSCVTLWYHIHGLEG